MTRSRLVVMSGLGLVATAAGVAGVLVGLSPARAAVGPLPPVALALPGDAPFLMGLDVKRLVASPFYRKQAGSGTARLDAFKEIQQRTGLDPERDVDAIVFAGAREGGPRRGVAIVLGRFEPQKLAAAIRQRPGVSAGFHGGVDVFAYPEAGATRGLALLDAGAIVLGEEALVRASIDNRGGRGLGVASNAAQVARLRRVRSGATFWLVGDASVLRALPSSVPAPGRLGGGGGSLSLPALQQVVVSGDFDPQIAVDVVGDTADEAGARNLADMLRGFIAFFSLQAGQRPELQGLASAFNVAQSGNQVSIAVRLSPDLVEALQRTARPATPLLAPEVR